MIRLRLGFALVLACLLTVLSGPTTACASVPVGIYGKLGANWLSGKYVSGFGAYNVNYVQHVPIMSSPAGRHINSTYCRRLNMDFVEVGYFWEKDMSPQGPMAFTAQVVNGVYAEANMKRELISAGVWSSFELAHWFPVDDTSEGTTFDVYYPNHQFMGYWAATGIKDSFSAFGTERYYLGPDDNTDSLSEMKYETSAGDWLWWPGMKDQTLAYMAQANDWDYKITGSGSHGAVVIHY